MKAAVSMLLEESDIKIKDVKKSYFQMSEIILDTNLEETYHESKSETLKFFDRDYQDIQMFEAKLQKQLTKQSHKHNHEHNHNHDETSH